MDIQTKARPGQWYRSLIYSLSNSAVNTNWYASCFCGLQQTGTRAVSVVGRAKKKKGALPAADAAFATPAAGFSNLKLCAGSAATSRLLSGLKVASAFERGNPANPYSARVTLPARGAHRAGALLFEFLFGLLERG